MEPKLKPKPFAQSQPKPKPQQIKVNPAQLTSTVKTYPCFGTGTEGEEAGTEVAVERGQGVAGIDTKLRSATIGIVIATEIETETEIMNDVIGEIGMRPGRPEQLERRGRFENRTACLKISETTLRICCAALLQIECGSGMRWALLSTTPSLRARSFRSSLKHSLLAKRQSQQRWLVCSLYRTFFTTRPLLYGMRMPIARCTYPTSNSAKPAPVVNCLPSNHCRFQKQLPQIFESFRETLRNTTGRMTAEQLKDQVLRVLRVWEAWSVYPQPFLTTLQVCQLLSNTH